MPDLSLIPPLPGPSSEHQRLAHTRKRLRLLTGRWFPDLEDHLAQHFDREREVIVGKPDLSTNVLKSVVTQLAVLYDRGAVLGHMDDAGREHTAELLRAAGWSSIGTRLQRMVLGLRESFLRPTLTPKGLLLRLVTPDMVYAEADPEAPDEPVRIWEARVRCLPGEHDRWFWDHFDASTATAAIIDPKTGDDVTAAFLGEQGDYPYRLRDGSPILPYATYHAERSTELWSWSDGVEAVEGTLTIAVLWSWWIHTVRDSSWAQRYTVDAHLRGGAVGGDGHATSAMISTDPSSVMQFRSDGDKPEIGQWAPPVDPETLGTALHKFERRLLVHFGLSPGDIQAESINPRESGIALAIKRESVRQAQDRYEPQFRRGDLQMLRILSTMDPAVPEDGWSITYPGPRRTIDEIRQIVERAEIAQRAGLASPVDAYLELHPDVTREQAVVALRRIADETRTLAPMRSA